MTAVQGNASVYQVNPVSRITGEGREEFIRTWGPDFDQNGAGGGGKGWGAGAKGRALGRIDVGVCYTRGARSRRWCGWWWGGELEQRHGWL